MVCGATLLGAASETAGVMDIVPEAPDKLCFVGGSEAASSSARSSIQGRSQGQSEAKVSVAETAL